MLAVRKRITISTKGFYMPFQPCLPWTNTLKLMPLAEPEVDRNVKHSNK